ncbi:MAG: homoserine kinase, partial [Actinomycetota bacterium]
MPDRVTVRAPATIANLGPGFDCLGVAIAWHNEIRVERDLGGGLTVTAAGQGADEIPRDASNLAVRAIVSVRGSADGLRVHLTNTIPFGRGFGSSATAIVGGMLAAHMLDGKHVRATSFVRDAAALEGHADNVAPCVFGGAVLAAGETVMPLGAPPGIEMLVCVAPMALSTEAARKVLPAEVP